MAFTQHEHWSGRLTFILAAVGSSVGLGNFWRFPYTAGENGGGAFVLIYLACVLFLGVPILLAELIIGRRSQLSALSAAGKLARDEMRSPTWNLVGVIGTVAGTIIVTFYSVIAGWIIAYLPLFWSGAFSGADVEVTQREFDTLLSDPYRQALTHGIFMAMTAFIIARGVRRGIERAVEILMPTFFFMLLGIVIYAGIAGDFFGAVSFLFSPDFSRLKPQVAIDALGQACFSIGVGSAIMITYGAYTSPGMSLPRSSFVIAGCDTVVALIAGLAIFPFVFRYGLDASSGPGLLFVTLPAAFGAFTGGAILGVAFLLLALFAALTSSISLLETVVSYAEERGVNRVVAATIGGASAFVVGLGSVFSNNLWKGATLPEATPILGGLTFFDALDVVTSNILLPLAALLSVVFAGWVISRKSAAEEFGGDGLLFHLWRFLARWFAPIAVGVILIAGLYDKW